MCFCGITAKQAECMSSPFSRANLAQIRKAQKESVVTKTQFKVIKTQK